MWKFDKLYVIKSFTFLPKHRFIWETLQDMSKWNCVPNFSCRKAWHLLKDHNWFHWEMLQKQQKFYKLASFITDTLLNAHILSSLLLYSVNSFVILHVPIVAQCIAFLSQRYGKKVLWKYSFQRKLIFCKKKSAIFRRFFGDFRAIFRAIFCAIFSAIFVRYILIAILKSLPPKKSLKFKSPKTERSTPIMIFKI